jgi:glycosyltransferase involved in cell wall biosynthesis
VKPKLFVLTTVPLSAWTVLRGSLRYLDSHGFAVTLVSSPGELLDRTAEREGVRAVAVPMRRTINVAADLRSLLGLYRLFRAERPDVVIAGTPKAGLLGTVAARLAGVPVRVYSLLGLRLETARGPSRCVLWLAEWVAAHAATEVLVVSPSLLRRAREVRIFSHRRGVVLGRGGGNGVDLDRFAVTSGDLRSQLGIPRDAFVFGFVGRCVPDKGVRELAAAFAEVARDDPAAWLLIVGDDDGRPAMPEVRRLRGHPRVRSTGWLADPALAYHAMDVLVLPTYREGFPNAPLEAGAAARPVITTTATGAVDSVIAEHTGLLVPPGDAVGLAHAMRRLAKDRELARSMGIHGREYVAAHFTNATAWAATARYLTGLRGHAPCSAATGSPGSRRAARRLPAPASVAVFVEDRFGQTRSGEWAGESLASGAAAWSPYAERFDGVTVVARARRVPGTACAEVGDVDVVPLPYYCGPRQLARSAPAVCAAVARGIRAASVVIVRLPGPVGAIAAAMCVVRRRPYAVEVVGDPQAVLAASATGRVGRAAAAAAAAVTRWQVRRAAASRYVTAAALQRRYPPRPGTPSVSVSNVRIGDADFVSAPRSYRHEPFRVVAIGSQAQLYKGHDVLLLALARLHRSGAPVRASIVGQGRHHQYLRRMAVELGIDAHVQFVPRIDERSALRALLDDSDVLAMPSRTEGLPRVLIEAMARALPAVGTAVGGIPELLDDPWVVPPEDDVALAEALRRLMVSRDDWVQQSAVNLARARDFHQEVLDETYGDWLDQVRQCCRPRPDTPS